MSAKSCPLTWGLPADAISADTRKLVQSLAGAARATENGSRRRTLDGIAAWDLFPGSQDTLDCAIACLAWCYGLGSLADRMPSENWNVGLAALVEIASRSPGEEPPLVGQLLLGELPLALAYSFPEIEACRDLMRVGEGVILEGMSSLIDDDGLPVGESPPCFPAVLSCWTRALALSQASPGPAWPPEPVQRFRRSLVQLLRLTRRDGRVALCGTGAVERLPELLEAAAVVSGDQAVGKAVTIAFGRRDSSVRANASRNLLPPPAGHSEEAKVAVLRSSWSPARELCAVAYGGERLRCELATGGEVLWSGTWEPEVQVDGVQLDPISDWEEVCWESDEDVDYVELERRLEQGVCVERQVILARQERFFFAADVIVCEGPRQIEYRSVLPLAEGIEFQPARDTCEGRLVGRKPRGLVLPLALGEWRSDECHGQLSATAEGLELRQGAAAAVSALYAPLFVHLDSARLGLPATWRQLTVAQDRVIQRRDVAAGYRIQVGRRQWLVYRALPQRGNRTLLGHNLSSEFLFARFLPTGEAEAMLEIE